MQVTIDEINEPFAQIPLPQQHLAIARAKLVLETAVSRWEKTTNVASENPWENPNAEIISTDLGESDSSINHDHYLYGLPKQV